MLPIMPFLPPRGGDRTGKQILAQARKEVWMLLRGIRDEPSSMCMTPSAFKDLPIPAPAGKAEGLIDQLMGDISL